MDDDSPPQFERPEELIEAHRLRHSTAESVYAWLESSSPAPQADYHTQRSEALEWELFQRNEALVDLGLACFGTTSGVVRAVYERHPSDRAMQCAAWSNPHATQQRGFASGPTAWWDDSHLHRAVEQGDERVLISILGNPFVQPEVLTAALELRLPFPPGPFEAKTHGVQIAYALRNPQLMEFVNGDRGYEGPVLYDPPLDTWELRDAAWGLFERLPASKPAAWLLSHHFPQLPLQRGATAPDRAWLENQLTRWVGAKENTKAAWNPFGEVRRLLTRSFVAERRDDDHGWLATHADTYVRQAFYAQTTRVDRELVDASFSRDGAAFAEALVENRNLYRHAARDALERFETLCENLDGEHGWIGHRLQTLASELEREAPGRYGQTDGIVDNRLHIPPHDEDLWVPNKLRYAMLRLDRALRKAEGSEREEELDRVADLASLLVDTFFLAQRAIATTRAEAARATEAIERVRESVRVTRTVVVVGFVSLALGAFLLS